MSIFNFKKNKPGSALVGPLFIFIFSVLGIIFFLILNYFFTFNSSAPYFHLKETSTISGQPVPNRLDSAEFNSDLIPNIQRSDFSMRLQIPKINIDALVESVGIMTDGDMDVPRGSNNVAWFNLGPFPGEIGSAVIDGHYGVWENGEAAVFNDLDKLKVGDEILIEDNEGSIIIFVVREARYVDDNEDATDIFISSDGKAHLNLITCSGEWNKVLKSYPSRLVVFTDRK